MEPILSKWKLKVIGPCLLMKSSILFIYFKSFQLSFGHWMSITSMQVAFLFYLLHRVCWRCIKPNK